MRRKICICLGMVITCYLLVVSSAQALVTAVETAPGYTSIIKKSYWSPDIHQKISLYLKVIYQPVEGSRYNDELAHYLIKEFIRSVADQGWKPASFEDEWPIFEDHLAWINETNQWTEDIVFIPEVGVNLQAKENFVMRANLTYCGHDPLWTSMKYRAGGNFEIERSSQGALVRFSKQTELKKYFDEVIQKLEQCIREKGTLLEEKL